MADKDGFPTSCRTSRLAPTKSPIEAGTLLGNQGNYSGDPNNPTGVHLHFSIVRDDGFGGFRNELEIGNTYDPSPYLGLPVNANLNPDDVPVCVP